LLNNIVRELKDRLEHLKNLLDEISVDFDFDNAELAADNIEIAAIITISELKNLLEYFKPDEISLKRKSEIVDLSFENSNQDTTSSNSTSSVI